MGIAVAFTMLSLIVACSTTRPSEQPPQQTPVSTSSPPRPAYASVWEEGCDVDPIPYSSISPAPRDALTPRQLVAFLAAAPGSRSLDQGHVDLPARWTFEPRSPAFDRSGATYLLCGLRRDGPAPDRVVSCDFGGMTFPATVQDSYYEFTLREARTAKAVLTFRVDGSAPAADERLCPFHVTYLEGGRPEIHLVEDPDQNGLVQALRPLVEGPL